jgi:hypothetical protein
VPLPPGASSVQPRERVLKLVYWIL